jgi:hypothetical protein
MKFQVGDRVRLKNDQNGEGKGLCGTLRKYMGVDWFIQLDGWQEWAHDGDGSLPFGYGWFVELANLEVEQVPYDPTQAGDKEDDI